MNKGGYQIINFDNDFYTDTVTTVNGVFNKANCDKPIVINKFKYHNSETIAFTDKTYNEENNTINLTFFRSGNVVCNIAITSNDRCVYSERNIINNAEPT